MNWSEENIVFIFSLPRSGSTLLQRILANHPQIASSSESWLLLPQLYALREGVGFAEYSQTAASRAINDFCDCMPGGRNEYLACIKNALIESFSKVAGNEKIIYLEKTPRNVLILEEIVSMFPKSKYIFLWRNPAAIVASMIESFAGGKWNLYRQEIDLYQGLENMLNADNLEIMNRVDIKYEDLVMEPDVHLEKLIDFIGLDNKCNIEGFVNTQFSGRMGDPTGVKLYSKISKDSVDKWTATFCNVLRKRWLVNYIEYIGNKNITRMGYDEKEILNKVSSNNTYYNKIFGDSLRMFYGLLDREFQLSMIRRLRRDNINMRKYPLQ